MDWRKRKEDRLEYRALLFRVVGFLAYRLERASEPNGSRVKVFCLKKRWVIYVCRLCFVCIEIRSIEFYISVHSIRILGI